MATIFDPYLEYLFGLQQSFVTLAGQNVWELILYTIGIAVYAVFIWHFYKYVSRRDVFKWDSDRFGNAFFYFVKYLIAYPVLVFVWFGIFATFIFVLGDLTNVNALLTAFAIVIAIRITAYYNEEISNDLGKLLPLAMLGVFILQPNFIRFEGLTDRFFELGLFAFDILKFTAVAVAAEWFLRIVWSIKRKISPAKDEKGRERFGR